MQTVSTISSLLSALNNVLNKVRNPKECSHLAADMKKVVKTTAGSAFHICCFTECVFVFLGWGSGGGVGWGGVGGGWGGVG